MKRTEMLLDPTHSTIAMGWGRPTLRLLGVILSVASALLLSAAFVAAGGRGWRLISLRMTLCFCERRLP